MLSNTFLLIASIIQSFQAILQYIKLCLFTDMGLVKILLIYSMLLLVSRSLSLPFATPIPKVGRGPQSEMYLYLKGLRQASSLLHGLRLPRRSRTKTSDFFLLFDE